MKAGTHVIDPMPLQYSIDGNTWKTPELPAGFFGSSSRYKYIRSSLETPSPDQAPFPTTESSSTNGRTDRGPNVSEHMQRVVREVAVKQHQAPFKAAAFTSMPQAPLKAATFTSMPQQAPFKPASFTRMQKPPMKRASVAGMQQPPMKRAAVAGVQQPMDREDFTGDQPWLKRSAVEDMLPPKKRHQHDGPSAYTHGLPPRPPTRAPQTDYSGVQKHQQETDNWNRSEVVRRDPLLHRSVVTPPPPLADGRHETPKAARSYTHVSGKK